MSSGRGSQVGHGLAKVLGIKLDYRNPTGDAVTRGESTFSASTADTYVEHEPTAQEWLSDILPSGRGLLRYAYNLFPFVHWIGRYNVQWLYGDLVAGESTMIAGARGKTQMYVQVLPSAPSWSRSQWPMPNWPSSIRNLACTRRSWAF